MTEWTPINKPNSTWDGYTPTFVSTSSTILDTASYDNFGGALTAIGSDNRTLYVTNDQTISSTTTLSLNVSTVVTLGGKFYKTGSGKLVINGPFSAGLYQVFSGFSAGDVTGLKEARPEWFAVNTTPGTTDMTVAVQSANDATPGGVLLFSNTTYLVGNITIIHPITWQGYNGLGGVAVKSGFLEAGSRIKAKTGTTGAVITITRGNYRTYEAQAYGTNMRDLFFDGNNRTVTADMFDLSHIDWMYWENVHIDGVKGSALRFNYMVRTSTFNFIRIRNCGSIEDDKPSIDLREHETWDGFNMIAFNSLELEFSFGHSIQIDSDPTAGDEELEHPRQITFNHGTIHGLTAAADTLPYTFTAAQKSGKLVEIGKTGIIKLVDMNLNAGGSGVPSIHLTSSASNTYSVVSIIGGLISSHYNGIEASSPGVQIDAGMLIMEGVFVYANSVSVLQTGGDVYLSPSNVFSGNTVNTPTLITNAVNGQKFYTSALQFRGAPAWNTNILQFQIAGDTASRLNIDATGDLQWTAGSGSTRASLYNVANGLQIVTGNLGIGQAPTAGDKLGVTGSVAVTSADFTAATAGKGVVLKNAAGTVTKRVRLNDAGDGLIFEDP